MKVTSIINSSSAFFYTLEEKYELLNWFINMDFNKNPYYWINSIKKAMNDEENEYELDGEAVKLKIKNGIVELDFILNENILTINRTHLRDINELQLQELCKYIETIIEAQIVLKKFILFETKNYDDFFNYEIEQKNSSKILIIMKLTSYEVIIDELESENVSEYNRESFENSAILCYGKLKLRGNDGLLDFKNEKYNSLVYRIYKD